MMIRLFNFKYNLIIYNLKFSTTIFIFNKIHKTIDYLRIQFRKFIIKFKKIHIFIKSIT